MSYNKSKVRMQARKRDVSSLTDFRTLIAMDKAFPRYQKFPNHQRVKDAVFASEFPWQERIAWMDRIIEWTGTRGENVEWQAILHNSETKAKALQKAKIDRAKSDANPWKNHGGRMSPFSDKFVGKTTKEEATARMKSTMAENPGNQNTRIEYYIVQGMGLCEAINARAERQATGSLEAFKSRYGEDEGLVRWKARQEKWIKSMNSKSFDEIARINATKLGNGYSVSKAEKEIFSRISHIGARRNLSLSYNDGKNYYIYDIFKDGKIIEYNGDFWHANPNIYNESFYNPISKMSAEDIWQKESHKEYVAKSHGYEIMKVWENDYKKDPEKEIQKCINFLTQ